MNEDLKKEFIKEVHAAAKSRYSVDVFADMVRAMAIAIEVPTHLGSVDALEAEYARIRDRYEPAEFEHFYRAFSIVMQAFERPRAREPRRCQYQERAIPYARLRLAADGGGQLPRARVHAR